MEVSSKVQNTKKYCYVCKWELPDQFPYVHDEKLSLSFCGVTCNLRHTRGLNINQKTQKNLGTKGQKKNDINTSDSNARNNSGESQNVAKNNIVKDPTPVVQNSNSTDVKINAKEKHMISSTEEEGPVKKDKDGKKKRKIVSLTEHQPTKTKKVNVCMI